MKASFLSNQLIHNEYIKEFIPVSTYQTNRAVIEIVITNPPLTTFELKISSVTEWVINNIERINLQCLDPYLYLEIKKY